MKDYTKLRGLKVKGKFESLLRFYRSSMAFASALTGMGMTGMGYLRKNREETVLRIDTFSYAFGMALIRLVYTM